MFKAILTLFLIFPLFLVGQQLPVNSINISLPQFPNANTANWIGGNSLLSITVSTRALAGKLDPILESSRILVQIKKGSSVVCGSYTPATAPNASFNSLMKIWSGNAAVGLLGQECKLIPGDYTICVKIFGGPNNAALSEEKCKNFTIQNTESNFNKPLNIMPVNEMMYNTQMASAPVQFKWSAVTPNPGSIVKYTLRVWKKQTGQSATQTINTTQPIFTKEYNGLTQANVPNIIDPSCLTGGCEFVWQVQASGANGITYGQNNGISDYTVFKTNASVPNTSMGNCSSISTKTYAIGDEISLSDDFKMKFSKVPTGTNDSLSGEGIVRVNWLGIFNVRFKGIKINAQDKLCSGSIHTKVDSDQTYPVQFLINAASVNNYGGAWTINKLGEVADKVKANKHLKGLVPAEYMPFVDSSLSIEPINMPIGYFKEGDTSEAFGFTEMIFRPDYAEFEAIASLNTDKIFKNPNNTMNGTAAIGLRGYGIRFTNAGVNGINGSLKIIDDIVVSYANTGTENLKMIFNKESNGHIGNGIVFSASDPSFWKYNLDVDIQLPREFLVPVDASKTHVAFNFQLNIAKWSDYVVEGTLPACVIPNTNGLGIKAGVIAYDHSFVSNPTGMVFPTGYAGNTNNFFSGFYLKNFSLTLPDELRSYADTSKRIEIIAQNLIIDEYGLSGKIVANNVINFPKANVGNLGASIDTVSVTFANGSLTEGKMKGKITLPLSSSSSASNALNYSALFASGTSSFVFMLKPGADISSKFLGDGKLKISPTSSMNLSLSKVNNKRAVSFNIDINGNLYYPTGKILDIGTSIPLDLDLSCNFQHLGMTYSNGASNSFTFNPGQWSFASPQKKFSGFGFTIVDVKPKIDPVETVAEKQYLFKGGVELVAKINIGSENSNIAISGDTKLILRGAILSSKYVPSNSTDPTGVQQLVEQVKPTIPAGFNPLATNEFELQQIVAEQYGFLTELKPKYLGVEVKSIHVDVTTPAVKIKGSVEFFKKDVKYGNGFKGELQAKFTSMNMAIQAGAVFGNTKYIPGNSGNGYKYWMVQAQANLPAPGIPFLAGVAFRGFGAGVYSRMKMTLPTVFNPTQASESTFGGAIFTPDASVKFGFKAKVILATTPKEETFNGSAALSAEFNTAGGMNFIRFDGLFYCGAKIIEPEKSFANGSLMVDYDFPQKVFNMNASLTINKDPISTPTPANMRLYIDGKNNKWYFKSGTPTAPMWVRISNTDIQAYLMFGNDLGTDIPKGFMQKTIDGFANLGYSLPQFNETATSDNKYQSAKGFAFGLGVHNTDAKRYNIVDFHGKLCDCRRFVDVDYAYSAGGEINASLLQYAGCTGFGKGWRARMSIAVYASANVTYAYSLPGFGDNAGWLASAKGSAYAIAEFPNPTYIAGEVRGAAKTLGGYGVQINKSFTIGSQCAGTEEAAGPAISYQQENVVDSLDYSLIKMIVTPGTENISRTTNFSVLYNYPVNKPFSIDEQQSNGTIKTRTFKATYTVTLKQDTVGTNIPNITLYAKGMDMYGASKYQLSNTPIVANPLNANANYRFQVNAKLEEQVNNVWVPVKKKGTTIAVTQQEQLLFKTDGEAVSSTVTKQANSTGVAPKKLIIQ